MTTDPEYRYPAPEGALMPLSWGDLKPGLRVVWVIVTSYMTHRGEFVNIPPVIMRRGTVTSVTDGAVTVEGRTYGSVRVTPDMYGLSPVRTEGSRVYHGSPYLAADPHPTRVP